MKQKEIENYVRSYVEDRFEAVCGKLRKEIEEEKRVVWTMLRDKFADLTYSLEWSITIPEGKKIDRDYFVNYLVGDNASARYGYSSSAISALRFEGGEWFRTARQADIENTLKAIEAGQKAIVNKYAITIGLSKNPDVAAYIDKIDAEVKDFLDSIADEVKAFEDGEAA